MTKLLSTALAFAVATVTFTSMAFAQDAKPGDATVGKTKIAMCIGCHGIVGYQASFPEVYKAPKISGQGAAYIVSALNAYQKGERRHPSMRGIGETLTPQDMADIAAYYSTHGVVEGASLPKTAEKEPSAAVAALLAKGACISCHGANFASPIQPTYPKIAGQHADYLFVALKSYKTEPNARVGRSNGVMGGIAKQFTNDELKALANYVGSLPGDLKTVPQPKFR
jgi:cytochrome c553